MIDNKPCILIVDDVEINVKLITCILKKLPYSLLTASSGQQALDAVGGNKVDLVLLDIMMPDMDGYEVLRRIRSNDATKNLPVVVLSALNMHDDVEKAMSLGANDYISKPIIMAKVLETVKKYV